MSDEEQPRPFPLSMASEGECVRIAHLVAGRNLEMRLTSMGLNVGSELLISQRQRGGVVVVRGEARLALGAGMARKIMVTSLQAARDKERRRWR